LANRAAMFRGAADVYDRFVGRYSPQLARAMCEAARVRPGQRALDVGCGSGALAAALAEVLGPENVSALDPSETFVESARRRVPGAHIVVGAAESLPFGDDEFDATLSQLVVNFLTDADQGLREMSRVTRGGGVVAGCVWDYGGDMTMLRVFWEAAAALDSERAESLMEAHTMRFARPDELVALWRSAGFSMSTSSRSSSKPPTTTSMTSGRPFRPEWVPPAPTRRVSKTNSRRRCDESSVAASAIRPDRSRSQLRRGAQLGTSRSIEVRTRPVGARQKHRSARLGEMGRPA
jgi:ubiquinone/menaquinone biosynthesis C-methylase UbiE